MGELVSCMSYASTLLQDLQCGCSGTQLVLCCNSLEQAG